MTYPDPDEGTGFSAVKHASEGEDLLMVSALEHYSYCARQCALIHREQTFDENLYTLRGRASHERVDRESTAVEDGLRAERALPIWSLRLGLVGKADLVQFHGETPYPVEYKYGPHSGGRHADLQLCGQAMCLEEMTGQAVPKGAVFIVSKRRRREVAFTPQLRRRVETATEAIRRLLKAEGLPAPVADARCKRCSLRDSCLPEAIVATGRARLLYSQLFKPEVEP